MLGTSPLIQPKLEGSTQGYSIVRNSSPYVCLDMNENKRIMPTKTELTLEQSQQGVSNDVLIHKDEFWYKRRCYSLIPAKSDSLPHAHAQTTKTYYWHQNSRIMKAQELKTKTFANSDIQDLPLWYQVYQGRLLAIFQDDAKYEHVGQDTRSQGGKDDHDKQGERFNDLRTKHKVKRQ
ncbi:hypothetical protein Tco_0567751 [Tanacetum coccineum]